MSDCTHPDFDVFATINRIEDTGRFNADIQIVCAKCKKKFRFIGLPMGLDMNGAAVSPDGTEGRFAIHPVGEKVPGLPDDAPAGFQIMHHPNKANDLFVCKICGAPMAHSRLGGMFCPTCR